MYNISPKCAPVSEKIIFLGCDGCLYSRLPVSTDVWIKVFSNNGWKPFVQTLFRKYTSGELSIYELIEKLTCPDLYRSTFGCKFYTEFHALVSTYKYFSIYQIFLVLRILKFCNCDISRIIKLPSYQKVSILHDICKSNYVQLIKNKKIDMLSNNINYSYCQYLIYNGKFYRYNDVHEDIFSEHDFELEFLDISCLNENQKKILNNAANEYVEYISRICTDIGINVCDPVREILMKQFYKYPLCKYSNKKIEDNEEPIIEDFAWDDIYPLNNRIFHICIPFEYFSDKLKCEILTEKLDYIKDEISSIQNISTVDDAILYDIKNSNLQHSVTNLFKNIYGDDNINMNNTQNSGQNNEVGNDWNENYNIGAQMFILLENKIVSDYCYFLSYPSAS